MHFGSVELDRVTGARYLAAFKTLSRLWGKRSTWMGARGTFGPSQLRTSRPKRADNHESCPETDPSPTGRSRLGRRCPELNGPTEPLVVQTARQLPKAQTVTSPLRIGTILAQAALPRRRP